MYFDGIEKTVRTAFYPEKLYNYDSSVVPSPNPAFYHFLLGLHAERVRETECKHLTRLAKGCLVRLHQLPSLTKVHTQ